MYKEYIPSFDERGSQDSLSPLKSNRSHVEQSRNNCNTVVSFFFLTVSLACAVANFSVRT